MDSPHHARPRRFALAAVFFALFLPCVPVAAASRPPKDLSLAIRFKDGKARFRQGEIIRLVLEFSSPTRNVYGGSTASYDRSGRIHLETFEVTPREGTADPLYDYYNSGVGVFFSGGLSSTFTLGEKPFTLDRDVNEWVRFDRPGHYTLRVTSPRVSRRGVLPEARWESIILTSNTLEIEIVPATPDWAAAELLRVVAALDGKDQAAREQAQLALRFLGTEAAAVEMARRIARGESYYLGVVGSPHRAIAVRELERLLEAPDTPISAELLGNLSTFAFYERLTDPMPRWQEGDAEATKVFQAEVERRRALYAEINAAYTKRLAAALATKTAAARPVTLQTLFSALRDEVDPALRGALIASFGELPAESQRSLLLSSWGRLAGPEMLPVLRRVYDSLPDADVETRGVVLSRLIELSPEEGRVRVLAELRRPALRIRVSAAAGLPDESLPELDELLSARLTNRDDPAAFESAAAVVARVGSPALLPVAAEVYDAQAGRWSCAIGAPLLAYLLRVDPLAGAERLRAALAAREETGCYRSVLEDVARLRMSPEIEEIAVAALGDPEPEVVQNAAGVLGRYGSPDAARHLWERLEALGATRRGKPAISDNSTRPDERAALAVESLLVEALTNSPRWAIGPQEYERLASLSVSEGRRASIRQQAQWLAAGVPVGFSIDGSEPGSVSVGSQRYRSVAAARERFLQYPRGTVFLWSAGPSKTAGAAFDELRTWLEQNGMRLERSPERP